MNLLESTKITINGKDAMILPSSTSRYKRLLEVDREKAKFIAENPGKTIADVSAKKLGEFAKKTADIILDFGEFEPSQAFFESEDFEYSQLEIAKGFFLLMCKLS